jgi:hypothetical protein
VAEEGRGKERLTACPPVFHLLLLATLSQFQKAVRGARERGETGVHFLALPTESSPPSSCQVERFWKGRKSTPVTG